jgi:phage gpG-like protein
MPVKAVRGIEVKGARELSRALKAADPALLKEWRAENKRLAGMVADTAQGHVPVRSGRLRASIRPGSTQKSGTVKAGGMRVPYAGPIHFGGFQRKDPAKGGPIRPNPFLYRALDERRDEVFAAYLDAVEKVVDKVNRT